MSNKIVAIVQARMGSKRLPGKALLRIGDQSALEMVLSRVRMADVLDETCVATTWQSIDAPIETEAVRNGVMVYRGSDWDVLSRLTQAASQMGAAHVVRVTADCPLVDPGLIDEIVTAHLATGAAVTLNYNPPTYPDGLDLAVLSMHALETLCQMSLSNFDREHVTTFIEDHPERWELLSLTSACDLSNHRWTLDTAEDLEFFRSLENLLGPRLLHMRYQELLEALVAYPHIQDAARIHARNSGHRQADEGHSSTRKVPRAFSEAAL